MNYQGVLKKMWTENTEEIQYYLEMETDFINMNQLLGAEIGINFVGYECLHCHSEKQIYRQGFCKSCFFDTPSAGDWIMRPELSKAHLGIEDRDLDYETSVQLTPHIVYLANSSNVKVGVTRKTQVPTRWIDQGAIQALIIARVPYRQAAGAIEICLKKYISDKTNWRKMLQNEINQDSLLSIRDELFSKVEDVYSQYLLREETLYDINFPVIKYPEKVKSLTLDKVPEIEEKLVGIKGQYLLFENDLVFNVRRHSGYLIELSY